MAGGERNKSGKSFNADRAAVDNVGRDRFAHGDAFVFFGSFVHSVKYDLSSAQKFFCLFQHPVDNFSGLAQIVAGIGQRLPIDLDFFDRILGQLLDDFDQRLVFRDRR